MIRNRHARQAILIASLLTPAAAHAEIGIGDIAIIRVNNGSDGFSYVSLVDIAAGETVKWTDSSWNTSSGPWRTTEDSGSGASFTAPTAKGSIVDLQVAGGGFNNGGDQVFLFQGDFTTSSTAASAKHKFGINWDNTGWVASSTGTTDSALPSTLGGSANGGLTLGTGDQWYYSGMLSGTSKSLLSAIANPANWTTTGTTTSTTTYTGLRSGASFSIGTAASFNWDANGSTSGTGGAGTWDSTTANRFSDAAGTTFLNNWVNSSAGNSHTAVFAGTAGSVTVSGGVTASGLKFDVSGYALGASTVTLTGSSPKITVTNASDNARISAAIDATAAGFTKDGNGELLVTGSVTGSLNVSAGLLRGVGTASTDAAGALIVSSGGSINPAGSAGAKGTMTAGNFDLQSGGSLQLRIGGLTPSNQFDRLSITGTVTINGNIYGSITDGFVPTPGDKLFILLNDGADAITGSFANSFTLDGQPTVLFGSKAFYVSYTGDSVSSSTTGGNDIVLTAVPEPSTLMAALGGAGLLGILRPRRKSSR